VILRAGIRSDAPGRDRAALQRPEKPVVPLTALRGLLDGGERLRDALVSAVDVAVDGLARLRLLSSNAMFIAAVDPPKRYRNPTPIHVFSFDRLASLRFFLRESLPVGCSRGLESAMNFFSKARHKILCRWVVE
jgi:hypothetical protein